jgi:hypothetical protein
MRSDMPEFHESADEADGEARWEAYLELMRRTGAVQQIPGLGDGVQDAQGSPWNDQISRPVAAAALVVGDALEPRSDPLGRTRTAEPEHVAEPDVAQAADSPYGERLDWSVRPPLARRGQPRAATVMAFIAGAAVAAGAMSLSPQFKTQHQPATAAAPPNPGRVGLLQPIQLTPEVGLPCTSAAPATAGLAALAAPCAMAAPPAILTLRGAQAPSNPKGRAPLALAAIPDRSHAESHRTVGPRRCLHCRRAHLTLIHDRAPRCSIHRGPNHRACRHVSAHARSYETSRWWGH